MAHYLDNDGLTYVWSKIKGMFALKTDVPSASSTTPSMDGTASTGTGTTWARADHVHPTDTSRAPLASPAFTGTPTAPTAADSTDNTQIATTEFVHNLVDGIQGGNSFGKVKVGNTTVEADSADDTLELIAGSNVTLTPDSTNDTVTIAATDTTYSNATTSAAGLMSSTDKSKLDDFQAASNYALKSEITGIYKYKGSVATESLLPSSGQTTGDVYDIQAASSYGAAGMNVAWTGSAWDALGEMFTITSTTNAEIDAICV